jgi:hypothetical protein
MPAYRPWIGRKFGVEMEMRAQRTNGAGLDSSEISRALGAVCQMPLANRAVGYYHSDGRTWDVKRDSSCGWEVATPALTMNAEGECDELRRACLALTRLTPRIDRTCGLHVHVELTDFDWQDLQRLISLWARYEPFFFQLTPPSRWDNGYCSPISRSRWTSNGNGSWQNTVRAINAQTEHEFNEAARRFPRGAMNLGHWFTAGRVEFRLGAGSVDYAKIRNWVLILLAAVQRAKRTDLPSIGRYTTIRQVEFPTPYIAKVLGLAPSEQIPEVPELNERLVSWAEARRQQFTGRVAVAS